MNTLTKLTVIALATLVASTSIAGAGGIRTITNLTGNPPPSNGPTLKLPEVPPLTLPHFEQDKPKNLYKAVECKVKGPLGVTDDMWVINTGNVILPSGILIKFRVPSTGDQGEFLLPKTLDVGDKVSVADLLSDAPNGSPCKVKLV
jgi:hypothetical protein